MNRIPRMTHGSGCGAPEAILPMRGQRAFGRRQRAPIVLQAHTEFHRYAKQPSGLETDEFEVAIGHFMRQTKT